MALRGCLLLWLAAARRELDPNGPNVQGGWAASFFCGSGDLGAWLGRLQ